MVTRAFEDFSKRFRGDGLPLPFLGEGSPYKSPHTGGHQDWCEACLTWIRSELMTELELYIQLMTVYLYDNFLFLRQILTLMCQITSEGYFSGNFRSPGGSCQLWLAHHPCRLLRLIILRRGCQHFQTSSIGGSKRQ